MGTIRLWSWRKRRTVIDIVVVCVYIFVCFFFFFCSTVLYFVVVITEKGQRLVRRFYITHTRFEQTQQLLSETMRQYGNTVRLTNTTASATRQILRGVHDEKLLSFAPVRYSHESFGFWQTPLRVTVTAEGIGAQFLSVFTTYSHTYSCIYTYSNILCRSIIRLIVN